MSVDDVELFKEVHGALLEKLWDVGGKIKLQLKDEMPVWLARSCASASPYEQLALTLLLCSQEESLPSHRTASTLNTFPMKRTFFSFTFARLALAREVLSSVRVCGIRLSPSFTATARTRCATGVEV